MTPETKRTFKVAITLCFICSIVVSSLAYFLKDIQKREKEAFRQQNILAAAGLWVDGSTADELFKDNGVTAVGIDLEDYKPEAGDLTDAKFDTEKALQSPALSREIPSSEDIAGLKKMEKYSVVYQVESEAKVQAIVLPIRGKGLWSTLYGFVALDLSEMDKGADHIKVSGLTYFKHGETPGLGGEVDNALWKDKWRPREKTEEHEASAIYPFDADWNVIVEVTKNKTNDHQVDAISGATLTSNGVTNMLQFWLGKNGFGPYIKNLAKANAPNSTDKAETASLIILERN